MTQSALPPVGTRLEEQFTPAFDAALIRTYAEISGDDNPLHTDPDVAGEAGFPAPLVHGMLVMAAFEPVLARWRPDLRIAHLSARFLQPLLAGEAAKISGRVVRADSGSATLRLTAQGNARVPSIIGEARLVPRPAEALA